MYSILYNKEKLANLVQSATFACFLMVPHGTICSFRLEHDFRASLSWGKEEVKQK